MSSTIGYTEHSGALRREMMRLADLASAQASAIYTKREYLINFRLNRADFLASGASQPFALEVAEAALLPQVEKAFEGIKSNAEQRAAFLVTLKDHDEEYKKVKDQCLSDKNQADLLQAQLELEQARLRVTMLTLEALTAIAKSGEES